MILFYVRHGDPIYDPDSLTPLGQRQAEALAKRLAFGGIDTVYSSTSVRAKQTARPTCEILKREPILLDFAKESHVWSEFSLETSYGRDWVHRIPEYAELFASDEIRDLGMKWYEHPRLKEFSTMRSGMERVERETDAFLARLGYEHDREKHTYRITRPNEERVALFAHQGFSWFFLSSILDIPYPLYSLHFDMSHTGVTALYFPNRSDGTCIPRILTLSNDSHLYREGILTLYDNDKNLKF